MVKQGVINIHNIQKISVKVTINGHRMPCLKHTDTNIGLILRAEIWQPLLTKK